MGNVSLLYGKCVKYYMVSVLLGSEIPPVTLRLNETVFIQCNTLAVGAALASTLTMVQWDKCTDLNYT